MSEKLPNPYEPVDSANKEPSDNNKLTFGRAFVLLVVAIVIAFILLQIWILTA
jgi:flagellar biogenesis protein FliO